MAQRLAVIPRDIDGLYLYHPSEVLPIVFAALLFISLSIHTYQNFYYHYWRVTFFLVYGNVVFVSGWILRAVSSKHPDNLALYIVQTILIYAGPPIYAAGEYNVLGRLMYYLPMHAPLHPSRVTLFFIYLGALVEGLTGAGAGKMASSKPGSDQFVSGGTLIAVAIVLQASIELVFMTLVATMHHRCVKAGMLRRNIRIVCITLYGTSILVLLRCIFRAVEAFTAYTSSCVECGPISRNEWYLYAFEVGPMLIYTFWLNINHPGRFLPSNYKTYLDIDGETERMGPGWIDERPTWLTFADPFNLQNDVRASGERAKFWLRPDDYEVLRNRSSAKGAKFHLLGSRSLE